MMDELSGIESKSIRATKWTRNYRDDKTQGDNILNQGDIIFKRESTIEKEGPVLPERGMEASELCLRLKG